MEYKFLKRDTRRSIVIMSVLAAIVAVALVMLGVLLPPVPEPFSKSLVLFVITLFALFILSILNGVIQIKVFNDYKGQTKSLCAEGIFDICLTILVFISLFLFSFLQFRTIVEENAVLESVDLRYFVGVFVAAFAFWKIFAIVNAAKQKRNNLWIEILICALWLGLAIMIFVTIYALTPVVGWLGTIFCVSLIGSMTLFNLYSYIFHEPAYLVTEDGLSLLAKDEAERAARMSRLSALSGNVVVQPQVVAQPEKPAEKEKESVEDKLAKLEELKAKGIITEEEYAEKRKKIIDTL